MEPCFKEKEIEKLLKAVFGNGEPGMRTDIAVIREKMTMMPTSKTLKISAFMGGFVAVGLSGIVLVLLKIFKVI